MSIKEKIKKFKLKKKPDAVKCENPRSHKKAALSAGAVLVAGGLLTAGIFNMNTGALDNSFLSDNAMSRKITNSTYDYKKADDHYIVRSDKELKSSDGFTKVSEGLYIVDKDKKIDESLEKYDDGDVTIADAEGSDVNPEEDMVVGEDTQDTETDTENADSKETDTDGTISGSGNELTTSSNDDIVLTSDTGETTPVVDEDNADVDDKSYLTDEQNAEAEKIAERSQLDEYLSTLSFAEKVKVAVIDTGVSSNDERVLNGANYSATGKSESAEDDNGHGSMVAKLILENTPNTVSILPVKVMDSTGHGTLLSLYKGIEYAVEQKVDIINISLASKAVDTSLIQRAINDAANQGITIIASAGNKGENVKNYTPANISSVITVAAVDENNNVTQYSNYGDEIDYAADGTYCNKQGTSYAAARVTFVASLIKSGNKNADVTEILNKCVYVPDVNKKYIGNGIVTLSGKLTNTTAQMQKETDEYFDKWEEMSQSELDEKLGHITDEKIAFFWQSLSEDEQDRLLEKSKYLNQNVTVSENGNVIEKSFIDYLNNDFIFNDVETADWTDGTIWNSSSGFFYCYLNYNSGKSMYKVDVKLSGTQAKNTTASFAASHYSGTDVAKISAANSTTQDHNFSVVINLKITAKTGYTVSNSEWGYVPALANVGFQCTNNAFHSWKFNAWNTRKDEDLVNHAILHEELNVGTAYSNHTVDINPTLDGSVINGGSGRTDLTFDVYGGTDGNSLLKEKVSDYYDKVAHGTHLKITNISCPTGYHATQESYEYDIKEDKTEDKAIKAPDITLNKYDVAYDANVPTNDMTEKFSVSGTTETKKGCTYGVENTIRECGYKLPGYTFDSWNTKANGSGTKYKPGDTYTKLTSINNDTVHLYAQWTKNNYTIKFDLNGGTSDTIEDVSVAYGDNVTLPTDAKMEGKTFVGWSTVKNSITDSIQSMRAGFSYINMYKTQTKYVESPQDITLYALYSIPVSDVASVQLQVWQTDGGTYSDGTPIIMYKQNIGFSADETAGFKKINMSSIKRLVKMLQLAGGEYRAYDDFNCNLAARIIATDHAGNTGTIWQLSLNGKINPPIPDPVYYNVKTDHYLYTFNTTGATYEYYTTTDGQKVPEGTSYKASFLSDKTDPVIPDGYERDEMTYKYSENKNAAENAIMDEDGNVPSVTIDRDTYFSAYYVPSKYKVHFKTASDETFIKNKNADNKNAQSYIYTDSGMPTMNIRYTELFDELPTAEKTGYTFAGWYVLGTDGKDTGAQIRTGDKYEYTRDIIVVPHWTINSYDVTFDAATNGGTLSGSAKSTFEYGATVSTNGHAASKNGFNFVGWNTNPKATSVKGGVFEDGAKVLNNGKMPAKNITVYAIYSRTVTAEFYSAYLNKTTGNIAKGGYLSDYIEATYYNNETYATITAPESKHGSLDWTFVGWSTGNNYDSSIAAFTGDTINIDDDVEFYGLYQKNVTLTYISNCDATIDAVSDTVYFNAAPSKKQGNAKKNFEGYLDSSLKSNEANSFVGWVQISPETNCPVCGNPTADSIIGTMDTSINGCKCKCFYPASGYTNKRQDNCTCCFMAGDHFSIDHDVTMAARWDAYPVISAKDTYISVSDKTNFEKKLLESAESMDNEDVTTPITIQNKDEIKEIINSTNENVDVTVIYKTTDSYGNTTTESKILHIVNSEAKEAANTEYSRFIDQSAASAAYNKGGLEANSLWLTKSTYTDALNTALANAENVKDKKMDTANSYILANGKAFKPQYVLKYTNSDIKAVKQYLKNNGYGKFQTTTNMDNGSAALSSYFETYVKGHKQ